MELKTIRYDVDGAVATVTLDRPDRLNSWTGRMHAEVRHVFELAETSETVRVVIVTGAGKGFCSGADTRALDTHVDRGGYDAGTPADLAQPGYGVRGEFDADFAWMLGLRVVTIAAVNGAAAGVGMALACWCDIRFAAAGAKWTTAHGRLNLPAEYGLSWLLPRLIGVAPAMELLLSSRIVLSEELKPMGLVTDVVPADQVLSTAAAYAANLAERISPQSLATTRRQVWLDQLHDNPADSVRHAQRLLDEMVTHPDFAAGVQALKERRPPEWT